MTDNTEQSVHVMTSATTFVDSRMPNENSTVDVLHTESVRVPTMLGRNGLGSDEDHRRRESLGQRFRGSTSSIVSATAEALGGSKIGAGSEMPTIGSNRPLPKALLPKDQRKPVVAYQPVIGSSLAFIGGSNTFGPRTNSLATQRRSSISTYYPLQTSRTMQREPSRTEDNENSKQSVTDRRGSRDSFHFGSSVQIPDVATYRQPTRTGLTSSYRKPGVVEESIYPMLRNAFGKDEAKLHREEEMLTARIEKKL